MAKFCSNCGAELKEGADVCIKCGKLVNESKGPINIPEGRKSKVVAGILALPMLIGVFGAHNFYLGYTGKAVAQLMLTLFGIILSIVIVGIFMVLAAWIWSLVDCIMIFSGSVIDANGNSLV